MNSVAELLSRRHLARSTCGWPFVTIRERHPDGTEGECRASTKRVIVLATRCSAEGSKQAAWLFMFGFPADSGRPADGGQDGTILEKRNSQLTGAVAGLYFILSKLNLLASPNLLEIMCLKEALGERSRDRRGDGRNAQPSLVPRPDADRTAQRMKQSTKSMPALRSAISICLLVPPIPQLAAAPAVAADPPPRTAVGALMRCRPARK
jgi:hypothetical protein